MIQSIGELIQRSEVEAVLNTPITPEFLDSIEILRIAAELYDQASPNAKIPYIAEVRLSDHLENHHKRLAAAMKSWGWNEVTSNIYYHSQTVVFLFS